MKPKTNHLQYHLGLLLIVISSALFYIQIQWTPETSIFDEGILRRADLFWINFIISSGFFISFLITHIREKGWANWGKLDEKVYSVALVLFSLSAHTLNFGTDIVVFADYATWMNIYVVLMHGAVLAFPHRRKLSDILQYAIYFMCGAGLVMSIYLCGFIAPLVGIGLILFFFFGFSLHVTVPLWFLLYYIFAGIQKLPLKYSRTAYWSGIVLPVIVLAIFTWRWQGVQDSIEANRTEYNAHYSHEYPEWVFLSQRLPDDALTERVITSKAFTQKAFWASGDWMPRINRRGLEYRHDPVATTARVFYGHIDISSSQLLNFLNSKYDARHHTHRRLWSGNDLRTQKINTTVDIYPDYRLAYVEKTIDVKNEAHRGRNQEAVYTFFMPEGAVASSLSLWIEGEEQKSRLTTRSKADSAYRRIVGVERRDPALMHWQEGNRLTVTVFPCPIQETRKFKIGITTPLKLVGDELTFENIYFDGPPSDRTISDVQVSFINSSPKGLDFNRRFSHENETSYTYAGHYRPDWTVSFKVAELAQAPFSFQGKNYVIQPSETEEIVFEAKEIILDINHAWSKEKFEEIWKTVKNREVFVFSPQKTRLTSENKDELFDYLHQQRFSLLPLNKIRDIAHTLVISYEPKRSPLLQDLKNSAYADSLMAWLQTSSQKIRWYRLSHEISPLLRSMRELDLIEDAEGNIQQLKDWLNSNKFIRLASDLDLVNIPSAGIQIIRNTDSLTNHSNSTAPDHLMRLFAYHDLLRSIGREYFDKKALEEVWVRKAEEAYIVSPISSLVVLETEKDYERFGIDKNKDTLGNASKEHSGSVPEPHEWALILLVGVIVVWRFYLLRR